VIDRDCYGAIPVFYSTHRPLVSTDMRLILEIDRRTSALEPCLNIYRPPI
jgi:hypothetical protein